MSQPMASGQESPLPSDAAPPSESRQARYSLFVAGVPSRSPLRPLLEYFQKFGQIKTLAPISNKRNGCFILETNCKSTHDEILSCTMHNYNGRSLQISCFRSGESLAEHNQQHNCRRVIVKRVPAHWSLEEVSTLLSKTFGPVQSIFRYMSSSRPLETLSDNKKFTHTYSVVFKAEESTMLAVQQYQLSPTILIEKYIRKRQALLDSTNSIGGNLAPVITASKNEPTQTREPELIVAESNNYDALSSVESHADAQFYNHPTLQKLIEPRDLNKSKHLAYRNSKIHAPNGHDEVSWSHVFAKPTQGSYWLRATTHLKNASGVAAFNYRFNLSPSSGVFDSKKRSQQVGELPST